MRLARLLLILCFPLTASATITLVQTPVFTSNQYPADTATYGTNNTAGNTLVAFIAFVPQTGTPPLPVFTDSQSNTWLFAGCDYPPVGANGQSCAFYAPNCKAGANTVSATGTNALYNGSVMGILEYSGILTVNGFDGSVFSSGTTWPQTTNTMSISSNEILVAYGATDYGNNGTWSGATSGYTQEGTYNGGSSRQMVIYDYQPSAGAYSWGINNTGGSNYRAAHIGVISLRSALPTIGYVQANQHNCTSAVSTCSVSFGQNVTAGDGYTASIFFSGSTLASPTCIPVMTSTVDSTSSFKVAPMVILSNDASLHRVTYYVSNSAGGANTVTATSTGCSQTFDMIVTEFHGAAHVSPLFSSAMGSESNSPLPIGPINNTTGMWAYSDVGGGVAYNYLFSATSGFTARIPITSNYPTYNYLQQSWDMPAGSSVSNTLTSGIALNGAWGQVLVFSPTSNTFVTPFNITANGTPNGATTISAPLILSVTAGDRILVLASYTNAATHPVSDSQSNTYTDVEGGDGVKHFDIATATASSSGTLTITVNPGAAVSFTALELPPSTVDVHSSAANSSASSINSGNITTTKANEYIVTLCAAPTATTIGGGLTTPSVLPTNSVMRSVTLAHSGGEAWDYDASQASIGTYSSTCTAASSQDIGAAVASFAPVTTGSTQPNVEVITRLTDPNTTFLEALR